MCKTGHIKTETVVWNCYTQHLRIYVHASYQHVLDFYKFKWQRNCALYCALYLGKHSNFSLHKHLQTGTGTHTHSWPRRLGSEKWIPSFCTEVKEERLYNSTVISASVKCAGLCCMCWSKHKIGNIIINVIIAGYVWMIRRSAFFMNTYKIVGLQNIQDVLELSPRLPR